MKKIKQKIFDEITEHVGAFGGDFKRIEHITEEIFKEISLERSRIFQKLIHKVEEESYTQDGTYAGFGYRGERVVSMNDVIKIVKKYAK